MQVKVNKTVIYVYMFTNSSGLETFMTPLVLNFDSFVLSLYSARDVHSIVSEHRRHPRVVA